MKKSKKVLASVLVVVAVLAVSASAFFFFAPIGVTADQVRDGMLGAVDNIETYKFDMDMAMRMRISNETGETEMTMTGNGSGAVDNANKKMKMEMSMDIEMSEEEEAPQQMETETYLINDTMYMKMDTGIPEMPAAQWMKMKIPMPEGAGASQDQIEQQAKLLEISEVVILPDEEVRGTDCYVLEIKPNMEKFWEMMMNQSSQSGMMGAIPPAPQNISMLKDMIKKMSMKQWTAKDTHFPMKTEMQMTIAMNSESMGIPETEEEFEITEDINMEMIFYDYNVPIEIELPLEAESAIEMPMMPMTNQTSPTATATA
jgi:hypothetical protein